MSSVLEDDLVESCGRSDLALVAHQALGDCVDGVEDDELSNSGRSWTHEHSGSIEERRKGGDMPDPNNLAVTDSFLKSFAADCATTSTAAGAMAYQPPPEASLHF